MIDEKLHNFNELDIVIAIQDNSLWMVERKTEKDNEISYCWLSNNEGDTAIPTVELRLATKEEKKNFKPSSLSIPETLESKEHKRKLAKKLKEVFDKINRERIKNEK